MPATAACPKLRLSDGNEIPMVGLGTWRSAPGEVYAAVCHAIDSGYRHLDCALAYENEAEIGKAIRDKIDEGVITRKDLFVTSKCWNTYRASSARVAEGLQKTLTDLGLEYLDLYLIHWPFSWKEGGEVFPRDEQGNFITSDVDYMDVWKAMEELQKAGKCRSIGVSNFNSDQLRRVLAEGSVKPVMNQVECHPYLQQEKLSQFCIARDVMLTAYSPIGSPYKTMTVDAPIIIEHPVVVDIAKSHGKTAAQVLLRFLIQRGIVVVPKSTSPARIESNFQVFDFELTDAQMAEIRKLDRGHRLVPMDPMKGHKYYPFGTEF